MRTVWIAFLVAFIGLLSTAHARTVTGYAKGQKTRVKLVWIGGVELEVATAKAFRQMADAARKSGVYLAIRSGFRSHDKQMELYQRYRRGWGHPAARPGFSNHQNGRAVDIYIDDYAVYEWLKKHAHRYGFKRTVKREAWHWEYVGAPRRHARRATAARDQR